MLPETLNTPGATGTQWLGRAGQHLLGKLHWGTASGQWVHSGLNSRFNAASHAGWPGPKHPTGIQWMGRRQQPEGNSIDLEAA